MFAIIKKFIDDKIQSYKTKKLLKNGEALYNSRQFLYDRTATQEELFKMTPHDLWILRDRYADARSKSLDEQVFFDGQTPYIIVDKVRYNLQDEVLMNEFHNRRWSCSKLNSEQCDGFISKNNYEYDESAVRNKSKLLTKQMLAQYVLGSAVVVLPWKMVLSNPNAHVLAIVPPPKQHLGTWA
jgi:hypothetical protein